MTLVLMLVTAALGLVQAGAAPALFADPLAAPVLPAILLVAWAALRGPQECWPAIPAPALILGVLSDERAGWFLLALLPAPLLGVVVLRRARRTGAGAVRRAAWSAAAAALAVLCYGGVLTLAAGVAGDLPASSAEAMAGVMLSALLGAALALAAWPLRRRERGLFA
ncbi:MAG: hypothetical protein AMXMBFR23_11440 [Chloroflexota bacterium]